MYCKQIFAMCSDSCELPGYFTEPSTPCSYCGCEEVIGYRDQRGRETCWPWCAECGSV